ncbi:hypothetical protein [Achromobacter xylosoxidans]|uniref:hypothetical protein n=1 Tax=Alcaligenes xylosoxydans xylosoxydans TaxID=85698 RepID=UPI0006C44A74|nr:hypothetical protein [Achromobacter xylosoxidans]CUJ34213.1 Uncharacterised protein [Achromobacter xylosoxidans]
MKASTLHSLITARTLHDEAVRLISAGDRHMSSAGLILLQDALEIVFLAMLVERDVDEVKSLESKSFDELIGELKRSGIAVPKSGTLKALNKQRVITKHYGQLAEPLTVQTYAEAADLAIEAIVQTVLGRGYRDVFLADLLGEGEARSFLTEAAAELEKGLYLESLISVRKALFVEIEIDYCVHKWSDADANESFGLGAFTRGGGKAPYWTRRRDWIEKNVRTPFDYIQIDHENLRVDALEWGVSTAELQNLRRLTPDVFREDKDTLWQIQYDLQFPVNEATSRNARYCLDRAISIILRKQQHVNTRRWPARDTDFEPPPIYLDAPVFAKPRQDSDIVHRVNDQHRYRLTSMISGFDPAERYYTISGYLPTAGQIIGTDWVHGFLLVRENA